MTTTEEIKEFVAHCIEPQADASLLLQILIRIQDRFSHVPSTAIEHLQTLLDVTKTDILSVISFYSFLSLENLGLYHVLFSDNITDRMSNNQTLYDQMLSKLKGASATIGLTSCTGLCDQGPGLLVNGVAINHLNEARIDEIAKLIQHNKPVSEWPPDFFQIEDNIRRRDRQLMMQAGNGDSLRRLLQKGADWFMQTLDESGLRGRGGAGFNTASKWSLCQQAAASEHYVVCNADEGEPGTFKDRVLLNTDAHSVIEGMTLCARIINARNGLIYLRAEYRYLLESLQDVLQQRRADGLLGEAILGQHGFDFDIDIHLGAGAYICGEESALIESLEGRRGIPRIRPPFPVVSGYKNKPTVVNNVETFWSASRICVQGSDWFTQAGTYESSGTRLLSISGDCEQPGIYEYPFGTQVDKILQDCGGQQAQAVQLSGAAGSLVLSRDFNHELSFEDLASGGSFMVIGPERNLMDIAENFARFFKHESCGFCTPCRVGTSLLVDSIERFRAGNANANDITQLEQILNLMQVSSFCGLGCSAPTFFLNLLHNSPHVFKELIQSDNENPEFNLDATLSESRQLLHHEIKGP